MDELDMMEQEIDKGGQAGKDGEKQRIGPSEDCTREHRPRKWKEIKPVILDENGGEFKYILIDIKDTESDKEMTIVRGYKDCSTHTNILYEFERDELEKMPIMIKKNWKVWPPGGGIINLNKEEKKIVISGSSEKYGRADHQKTQEIIETEYLGYDVSWKSEIFQKL